MAQRSEKREKTQPATTKVYPTGKLPESIDRLYPKGPQGRGGPDAVAIDVANKRIVVFDSAPTQNAEHVAKTYRDADTLKNNLPPEYSGFDVFSQEGWYTGGIRFSAVKKH